MQEEVESKMIALSMNTLKLTARELKSAIEKYLNAQKTKKFNKDVTHEGKQTIKQLSKQKEGLSTIDITDKNIKSFDKVARKYGVDYALKKDKSVDPPKYIVFFKAKDMSAINAAFNEYTNNTLRKKSKDKTSLLEKVKLAAKMVKEKPAKTKHKELDR